MSRPNIVLIMCDDLGYGDTGFNGNTVIHTPHLDAMRTQGGRFRQFFAGGPVCSPTRGTCLTGRHYWRYGITHANRGRLPVEEISLGKICRSLGYRTGHFRKWHLGTMTRTVRDANRGGKSETFYSPPQLHGFDTCFSTESKVPTWDPMLTPDETNRQGEPRWGAPGEPFGTHYWNEDGRIVRDNLEGDDSRVIVDRAEPFIREAVQHKQPFFAVVWFHAPHTPVVAGPKHRAMYRDHSEDEQHYYGCITAMDEQVGRLNHLLAELGVENDTAVFFCSDNGPEGGTDLEHNGRNRGVTGGLRGRKRSLFNGGVGVPALVKWPGVVRPGEDFHMPCSTLDYLPTLIDALGYNLPDDRPIDGESLMPLLRGRTTRRDKSIPYRFLDSERAMFGSPTTALINSHYKLLTHLGDDRTHDMLFDLETDLEERNNIIDRHPEQAAAMRRSLEEFAASCRRSHAGEDYPTPCEPVNEFQEVTGGWR